MFGGEHTLPHVLPSLSRIVVDGATPMPLHHPAQNRLLAALPRLELERLRPELEVVPMPSGTVVQDAGRRQEFGYFPTSGIVALIRPTATGTPAGVAIVGCEGLVGIDAITGGDAAAGRAVVQSSGYAYRLGAAALAREFRHGGKLQPLALAYAQALIAQMAQTAVCRRHHTLEQQVCRWLLLSADRLQQGQLSLTLGLMVRILGASRERILHALASLQSGGALRFRRGAIEIGDRECLDALACGCHAVVAREYDRLLASGLAAPSRAAPKVRIVSGFMPIAVP